MAKNILQNDNLEQLVGSFVDLRTGFGKKALARASRLKGPRRTALLELVSRLKGKGITRLSRPLKFKFVGYEEGSKFETVGTSIAGPKLRYLYKYAISLADRKASYVAGVGHTGILGEIQVGRILREELPVLLPIFGDERYEEFFSEEGRKKRTQELGETGRRTIDDIIIETLGKTGLDISDLKNIVEEYLTSASLLNKGSDLYWLRGQFDEEKIQDAGLEQALINVMEDPEYNNNDAKLVVYALMELRKKPLKGLIGGLREDLLFLEQNPEIHQVDLNQRFRRRRFYPSKDWVEDGNITKKLEETSLSFSEALGILRAFPGMAEVRRNFNRANAEKYFGKEQEGVKNLNQAIKFIMPYFKKDKEEYHEAKRTERKENLFLKNKYHVFLEIDELRNLGDAGNWGNLVAWTKMKDSRRVFSGLWTLNQQIKLAQSFSNPHVADGIMATNYEDAIDFKEEHGIDLQEAVRRVSIIELGSPSREDRQRAREVGIRISLYNQFRRQNLERLDEETEFGIIPVELADKLAKCYALVEDYAKNSGELRKKTRHALRLVNCFNVFTYSHVETLLNRNYLSPEDNVRVERFCERLKRNPLLEKLTENDLANFEKKKREIERDKDKKLYKPMDWGLAPYAISPMRFFPITSAGIEIAEPEKINERIKELGECKRGENMAESLIQELKAISQYTSARCNNLEFDRRTRVRKSALNDLISDLEKNPKSVLVSDRLFKEIGEVYRKVESYRRR